MQFVSSSIECRNQILKNYPIRNSKGNLVWDVLFRMLMEEMESDFGFVSCEAFIANRGCLEFCIDLFGWYFVFNYAGTKIYTVAKGIGKKQ